MAVPRGEASRFGVVQVGTDGKIVEFLEKPQHPPGLPGDSAHSLVSMGIYVFDTNVLLRALRDDAKRADSTHDFGRDMLPQLVGEVTVFAHRFNESCVGPVGANQPYWRDVGTVESYWQANMDLLQARPPFDLYDGDWPIWTCPDQRPAAKIVHDQSQSYGLVTNSILSSGVVVSGATVRRSLLFTDVRAGSASLIENAVVLPGCEIGAKARIRNAILAEGCRIPAGLVLGENATDDAKRFLRMPSGIIVVTPQMLERLKSSLSTRPASAGKVPVRRIPVTARYVDYLTPSAGQLSGDLQVEVGAERVGV
jgi:glucose-1-phosphate adenylyltransferase